MLLFQFLCKNLKVRKWIFVKTIVCYIHKIHFAALFNVIELVHQTRIWTVLIPGAWFLDSEWMDLNHGISIYFLCDSTFWSILFPHLYLGVCMYLIDICKGLNVVIYKTFSSVQFSHSVVSDSLRPHELQHARPPCPSPSTGVHSDSRPSSPWCHPAISSSVIPFSSCPQSLPASALSARLL